MPSSRIPPLQLERLAGCSRWLMLMCLLGLSAGCQGPATTTQPSRPAGKAAPRDAAKLTAEQMRDLALESNISGVAAFLDPYNPWLWTEDRSRVVGIVVRALYLEGPGVTGVFGDGIIRPRLYVLEGEGRQAQPVLIKEWTFDPQQALPYRSKKRTLMGWGYRFHLLWNDELKLAGRQVRLVVSYERTDGTLLHSAKKDYRVPNPMAR